MKGVPRRSSSRSSGAQHWPNSTSCSELLYLITRTDPISCTECTDQQIFRELLHLIFAQRKYRNFGSCSPLSTIILYLSVDDFWASHILNEENILTLRRRKAVAAEADNELSSFPIMHEFNRANKHFKQNAFPFEYLLTRAFPTNVNRIYWPAIQPLTRLLLRDVCTIWARMPDCCCLLLFLLRCLFEESAPQ